jgi:uncharacterized membrane protein YsdA (DUF1294 family)
MSNTTLGLITTAAIYGLMSLITFTRFGLDKRAAIKQRRRTPERTLHLHALLGGWPGALIAMQVFRHKRRKPSFVRVVRAIAALHGALWIGAAYLILR